jgi:hypothetical protein
MLSRTAPTFFIVRLFLNFGQVSKCHMYARPLTEISQPTATKKNTGCECFTVDASMSTTPKFLQPMNRRRLVRRGIWQSLLQEACQLGEFW